MDAKKKAEAGEPIKLAKIPTPGEEAPTVSTEEVDVVVEPVAKKKTKAGEDGYESDSSGSESEGESDGSDSDSGSETQPPATKKSSSKVVKKISLKEKLRAQQTISYREGFDRIAANASSGLSWMNKKKISLKTLPDFLRIMESIVSSIDVGVIDLEKKAVSATKGLSETQILLKIKESCVSIADKIEKQHSEAKRIRDKIASQVKSDISSGRVDTTADAVYAHTLELLDTQVISMTPWQKATALYAVDSLASAERLEETEELIYMMVAAIVKRVKSGEKTLMGLIDAAVCVAVREDIRRDREVVADKIIRALRRVAKMQIISGTEAKDVLNDSIDSSILKDAITYVLYKIDKKAKAVNRMRSKGFLNKLPFCGGTKSS